MRHPAAGALLALVPAWVVACSVPERSRPAARSEASTETFQDPLPMSLHGMPLLSVVTGTDAESLVELLHGHDVPPLAGYVGHYGGGGVAADLFVSRFADAAEAERMGRRMSESIGAGHPVFGHHAAFVVDGTTVHTVVGQGRTHFFYARDTDVRWLAVEPAMARVALADLMGTAPDHITRGVRVDGVDVLPPPDSLYRRGVYDSGVASQVRRPR